MEIILSPCHSLCYTAFMPVTLIIIERKMVGVGGIEREGTYVCEGVYRVTIHVLLTALPQNIILIFFGGGGGLQTCNMYLI